MRTLKRYIPWIALLVILILVLAACATPSGTSGPVAPVSNAAQNSAGSTNGANAAAATNAPVAVNETSTPVPPVVAVKQNPVKPVSVIPVSLPTLDFAVVSSYLQSINPAATPTLAAGVPFIHYVLTTASTPDQIHFPATSFTGITGWQLLWKNSPVPYPFVLYATDCSQPVSVDSFFTAITTNRATNFTLIWVAFLVKWDASHTNMIGIEQVKMGSLLPISFSGAGTQTIHQDVPFPLNCGSDYYIVNAEIDQQKVILGYPIMQPLTISPNPTATPLPKLVTAAATEAAGHRAQAGDRQTHPQNRFNSQCDPHPAQA